MKNAPDITLKIATTNQEFTDAEQLFREYASSLEIDLAFQDFAKELTIIGVQYNKPSGALILAYSDIEAVGCAAVRKLDDETAELKRMYVKPQFRGHKIAQKLLQLSLDIARDLHYKKIRLDTIPSMTSAQKLYLSNGFYVIEPYRFNPVEGAIYMERRLDT
jgi:ribosomal protein S18 acetylase RimI-like enzyme